MHLSHLPELNKLAGSVWFSIWYIVSAQEVRANITLVIRGEKIKWYTLHRTLKIWQVSGKEVFSSFVPHFLMNT